MKATLIIALVCALGIRPALAVTLISDVGQTSDGVGNLLNTQYRYATDFTTNGVGSTITGGTFTMDNLDNITHNFIASIYTDNSGTPGTLVGTFNSFAVSASTGNGNYSSTPNGSINLAANTTYWEVMQMVEGLGTGSAPQVIYTSSQNTDSGSLFSFVP